MCPTGAPAQAGSPDLAELTRRVREAERENAEGRPARARRRLLPVLRALDAVPDGDADVVRVRAWALMELARSEFETQGSADATVRRLDEMVEAQAAHRPQASGAGWPGLRPAVAGLHGLLALRAGRLDEALTWLDTAVTHIADAEPLDACRMLLNRGVVHAERRELGQARADYAECARRARAEGFARLQFKAEHNRGHLELYAGRLPQALARMEAAARTMPGQWPIALLDRALVLLEAGLVQVADRTFAEAAAQFADQQLPHDVGECELGRAECAAVRGDSEAARQHAAVARHLFRRRGDETWVVRATLGELQADAALLAAAPERDAALRRRWASVSRRAARVEELCRQTGRPLWALSAACLRVEADLARGACDDPAATLELLGPVPVEAPIAVRLQARRARALLELAAGRREAAVRDVRAGQRDLRVHRARFGSLDLRTAGAVHGTALADLDLQLATATGRPGSVLDAVERVRAVIGGTPRVTPPEDPVTATLLTELRQLVAENRNLQGRPASDPGRDRLLADSRRLQHEILARSWHEQGRLADDRAARSAEVRRALSDHPGAVLVDVVEHRGEVLGVRADASGLRLRRLGDVAPLREHVHRVHADLEVLANPLVPRDLRAAAARSLTEGLEALQRTLGAVVDEGCAELVVVAGGWLGLVPWAMLPARRGLPTVVAPSVRHWLTHAGGAPRRPERVTAAAGPGLVHGEDEARRVAGLWPAASALVGEQATVGRMVELLASPGIVHLAAHGRHEPDNPLFSSVRLADGPLFAHELDGGGSPPHLVVLSSCEVGRTSVRAGGEALGMASVLLRTGVGAVVAATAPLPDDTAIRVMTRAHQLLRDGEPIAPALARATAEDLAVTGRHVPLQVFGAPV